jgi:hypothetical protein
VQQRRERAHDRGDDGVVVVCAVGGPEDSLLRVMSVRSRIHCTPDRRHQAGARIDHQAGARIELSEALSRSREERVRRSACKLASQPGSSKAKLVPDHVNRPPGCRGRFFSGHAGEVVHLDNLSHRAVFPFERLERSVEIQHLHITAAVLCLHFDLVVPGYAAVARAALGRGSSPSVIDEQLPHDPRGER